jgi:hypothetical protein
VVGELPENTVEAFMHIMTNVAEAGYFTCEPDLTLADVGVHSNKGAILKVILPALRANPALAELFERMVELLNRLHNKAGGPSSSDTRQTTKAFHDALSNLTGCLSRWLSDGCPAKANFEQSIDKCHLNDPVPESCV